MIQRIKNIHPIGKPSIQKGVSHFVDGVIDRWDYYKNTEDGKERVRDAERKVGRITREAGDVVVTAVGVVAQGLCQRMKNYFKIGKHVYHGQYKAAGETVVDMELRRLKALGYMGAEIAGTAGNGTALIFQKVRGQNADSDQRKFMRGLKRCCIMAGAAWVGMELYDIFSADAADGVPIISVDELPGVENGFLVDDSPENLQGLAALGEVDSVEHIEDVERDAGIRMDFLMQHGFSDTPPGWEVHHIIPLSEGGADSVENMVLLREEDHAWVTLQHQRFYGWDWDAAKE